MKKQLSYVLISFFFSLFVSGCGDDLAAPEADGNPVPITFSTSTEATVDMGAETNTRTTTSNFPNNGSIAIVAANASSTAINAAGWAESNLHMNHVKATAGTWSNSSFPVSINDGTTFYWPFNPDQYLTFAAYSPATHATMKRKKDVSALGETELQVDVNATDNSNKAFPDLLYSTPTGRWNKNKDKVSLTEFKHAMARLIVKVVGIDEKGNKILDYSNAANLEVSRLNVCTKVTKGIFDFVTPGWTLTAPGNPTSFHTLHSFDLTNHQGKLPYDSSEAKEIYILPSTSDVQTVELSKIEFNIKDAVLTYGKDEGYLINEFNNKNGNPVTLTMGQTTILTFKIRIMEVSTGDTDKVVLEGILAPWDYKGNSSVTIE